MTSGASSNLPPRRRLSADERLTNDVRAILRGLEGFLNTTDADDRRPCDARCGVYAFYDYDGEPIYVGQTFERLRVRIRRHLSNQRTDAVAMHVLDPMEVAEIEVWPFWGLENASPQDKTATLNRAEYTVFTRLSQQAQVSKLLNEVVPTETELIDLPPSLRGEIIPVDVKARIGHADERIARRAATIANLAQVIRERDVSLGLRGTLVTQAERLELLAQRRWAQVAGEMPREEREAETTREGPETD